jgi:hypothetical protein
MEKELRMFANHSKLFPDINSLRPVVNQLTRPSSFSAGPDWTCSHVRSTEEKLTGVLIILSILALILTF